MNGSEMTRYSVSSFACSSDGRKKIKEEEFWYFNRV